jgi:hypothetical protein
MQGEISLHCGFVSINRPAEDAEEFPMRNQLLEKVEYKIEETPRGVWRRFMYAGGECFAEYRSNTIIFGLPLVHFTRGKCPETGKRIVAKGFIAVGRMATGVVAVGQLSAGIIAFGQAGFGLLFCLAQAGMGIVAAGQLAVGAWFGAGQLATGFTAIGQLALGKYVLAQMGFGRYLWTSGHSDPIAVRHFQELWNWFLSFLPWLG